MSRGLKITIHERAGATRQRSTSHFSGGSSEPGTDYVMPPPEDPGTDYVMPPPEDPGTDYVMPPPEDPSGGAYILPSNGGPGALDTVVTVSTCDCGCGCTCGCKAPAGQQPAGGSSGSSTSSSSGTSRDYSGFVIVRMADGVVGLSPAENLWTFAKIHSPELTELEAILELPIHPGTSGQQTDSGSAARQAIPSSVTATPAGTPPPSPALPQPPAGALVSRPLIELRNQTRSIKVDPPPPPPPPYMERKACLKQIRDLEAGAATSTFSPFHSLTAYWRVDVRQYPDLVDEVIRRLRALPEVDLVYRELTAKDPGPVGQIFADDQGYLSDAPVGIGASWAWQSLAGSPSPLQLTMCDLEQGWIPGHQDLNDGSNHSIVPTPANSQNPNKFTFGGNRAPGEGSDGYHGTAVLGQLAATGTGVKGAATGYAKIVLASHYRPLSDFSAPVSYPFAGTSGHVAAAIVQALSTAVNPALKPGDVLLLEVQRDLLPTEVDEADFDAIRLASALGVTVVEAAGNGGAKLDSYTVPETGRSLSRSSSAFKDSGAILVGAARAALPHDRAPFSNYGSRLDCFGWGETVTSCGFGDLAGTTVTNYYTNSFNGTSSASPIVAGAAALVQALYNKAVLQQSNSTQTISLWLDPRALRTLLSDPSTGTRQGPNVAGFIGVMPDLRAIVQSSLGLVADIYMRRHLNDDGSLPSSRDEISSSPDILVWKGGPPPAVSRFGEGLRANTPAPGSLLNPGSSVYPNDVYVRLRNRGGVVGQARVQLFASPAATLITPERWLPVGSLAVQPIPPGDTLTVSSPLVGLDLPGLWLGGQNGVWPASFTAIWSGNVAPFSLLAVQVPWDVPTDLPASLQRPTPLPPSSPYFDWAKFRAFLRGPGVAWRNAYPVAAGNATTTLAFLITGTPDSIRHFDFEVIQRLPAGATVQLAVPDALAAKLRQRQPALTSTAGGTTGPLTLPRRPRTAIRGVELAAGACSPATFTITPGTGPLATGHSLAIRQLWKGEEVGRITWWFITQNDPEADL
jgi:serine protease